MHLDSDKIRNHAGETLKAGCVVIDGSRVLLISNAKKTVWAFPKGHAEAGESAEQAAKREVLEETGYEIEIIRPLPDVVYRQSRSKEPVRVSMFLARPITKTENRAEEVWEWVEVEQAKKLVYPNLSFLLNEINL